MPRKILPYLRLAAAAAQRITLRVTGWPVRARHAEMSVIVSPDDDPGRPSRQLVTLALAAAQNALEVDLSGLKDRSPAAGRYINEYPGEHYRLLAGLVRLLSPRRVVEIGTYTGLSALAMLHELPADGRITTFDLWPWQKSLETRPFAARGHEPSALRAEDFSDGRLVQALGDLSKPDIFRRHESLLSEADLIFLDGPKDGSFESMFLQLLQPLPRSKPCLLVLDDIRILTMIRGWREIPLAKLDATSLGHWTGTGLAWLPASNRDGQ
jgi:predicted O-methyltransferase YrrM